MRAIGSALAVAFGVLLGARPAFAEIEAGGVLGWRWFHERTELGRYLDDPPETALNSAVALGMRVGWLPLPHWGVEGELTVVPTGTRDGHASILVVVGRVQGVFNLLTGPIRPFVALGAGSSFASTSNPVWTMTDADAEAHVGCGVRVDMGPDWGVRLDARATMSPSQRSQPVPGAEALLTLYGRFPWQLAAEAPKVDPNDTDGDGVANSQDKCPDQAGAVTREGCPGAEKSDDQIDAEQKERKEDAAPGDKPKDAPKPAPSGSGPAKATEGKP